MTQTLYDNIVDVVEAYLGPAAQRFVDRQIRFHLDKAPSEITSDEVPRLTEWIRVSLALLTDDHTIVDECAAKLASLS